MLVHEVGTDSDGFALVRSRDRTVTVAGLASQCSWILAQYVED
jgi:hypothetical protein